MSDPLTLGLASTAVSLVNGTISIFKQVNESAKKSDDLELKQGLNDLYGQFVEIKAQILDLAQENADLRMQLTQRESVKRDAKSGNYFADGDADPLCPLCWERDGKLAHLRPARPNARGVLYRRCLVCDGRLLAEES
jgi:hypothetical protein